LFYFLRGCDVVRCFLFFFFRHKLVWVVVDLWWWSECDSLFAVLTMCCMYESVVDLLFVCAFHPEPPKTSFGCWRWVGIPTSL
jgi:hypothetical protein